MKSKWKILIGLIVVLVLTCPSNSSRRAPAETPTKQSTGQLGQVTAILNAEGERQAAILRAEGFSMALQRIFDVAHSVDSNTMSLQYLEALKQIGLSPSTKWVIPLEFSTMLSNVIGQAGRAFGSGSNVAVAAAAAPETPVEAEPAKPEAS